MSLFWIHFQILVKLNFDQFEVEQTSSPKIFTSIVETDLSVL